MNIRLSKCILKKGSFNRKLEYKRKVDERMNEEIKILFSETFDGPKGNRSLFTESKPGSGLFGTLDSLRAEEASILVGGVTIAAHTDHTRYHLWACNQTLEGKKLEFNWDESWEIAAVGEHEWKRIMKDLHLEYRKMTDFINAKQELSSSEVTVVLGALAHAAYHLGAIRQLTKSVK
ncbi:hypothetical protein [Pradoshia eiseniae]|nr:hypothetical protein [Pradoshia eiseniae]